jgi:poly(A) polymerase
MLRAYRLAGQLRMTLTQDTREAVRQEAPSLERTAPERRRYEWELILGLPAAFSWLVRMDEDGLLDVLFPEMVALRHTPQNGFHHLHVHGHTLLAFQRLEEILRGEYPLPDELSGERDRYLAPNHISVRLKWSVLAHDLGKPAAAGRKGDRLTFYGHDRIGQEVFDGIAERLRLGSRAREQTRRLIGLHLRPFHLLQVQARGALSRRALLRFLREGREDLTGTFLLALADSLASRGPDKPSDLEARLLQLWQECRSLEATMGRPGEPIPPLITGRDLIRLGYPPGPFFKTILERVREEQWLGNLQDGAEALEWVRRKWGGPEEKQGA